MKQLFLQFFSVVYHIILLHSLYAIPFPYTVVVSRVLYTPSSPIAPIITYILLHRRHEKAPSFRKRTKSSKAEKQLFNLIFFSYLILFLVFYEFIVYIYGSEGNGEAVLLVRERSQQTKKNVDSYIHTNVRELCTYCT